MKKILTILITLLISICLISINTQRINAEGVNDACSASTAAGATCTISNEQEFKDWAANTNGTADQPITGQLAADITVQDQVHVKGFKALDLGTSTLKGSFTSQPDPRKANYKEHILNVDENASLTLSGTTGTINGEDCRGGIMNEGTLIINSGTITHCAAHSGAGVFNINTFTMNGGTISNCKGAYQNIDGYGGGVYNHNGEDYGPKAGATFNFKGGTIDNCSSYYGGGVYVSYPGTFEMGGSDNAVSEAKITNCVGTFSAGAINGVGKVTLKGGTVITGNYSPNCAIIASLDFNIVGPGNITIKNENPDNHLQKDILVVHNENFEIAGNQKLHISGNPTIVNPIYLDMVSSGYVTEELEFVFTDDSSTSIKDNFKTVEADQYLSENPTTKSLTIKRIKVQQQPTFSNGYTVGIGTHDLLTNNLEVSYQWKYANNLSKVQIGNVGNYKSPGQNPDIDVTVSNAAPGSSSYDNYSWKGRTVRLEIKGLKKEQLISFDYDIPKGSKNARINLLRITELQGGGISTEAIVSKDVEAGSSTYSLLMPEDSTNTVYHCIAVDFDNEDESKVAKVSNIFIKAPDNGEDILAQTTNQLTAPLSDKNVYCEITITNKNYGQGNDKTKIIRSNVVEFAKIEGNKEFYLGDNDPLVLKIAATDASYARFLQEGEVYIDATSAANKLERGKDYTVSKGSIVINIMSSKLKTLKPNSLHSIYVTNITSGSGFNYATALFYVKAGNKPTPEPSPSPSKKDESCEKVIGPTWHWNNDKGICEDVGVVGTATR